MKKSFMLPLIGKLGLVLTLLLSASCSNDETLEEEVLLTGNEQSSALSDKTPTVGKTYYIKNEGHNNKFLTVGDETLDNGRSLMQYERGPSTSFQRFKITDADNGYVRIYSIFYKKYITLADDIYDNGTYLTLNEKINLHGQQWTIKKGGSTYIIKNRQSKKLMEVEGKKTGNGALIQQWRDANHDWQRWIFQQ